MLVWECLYNQSILRCQLKKQFHSFLYELWYEKYETANDKTDTNTCATSKYSDQPAQPRSLIRVFTDRMCLLQHSDYRKNGEREPLPYWMDLQAHLSLPVTQVYQRFILRWRICFRGLCGQRKFTLVWVSPQLDQVFNYPLTEPLGAAKYNYVQLSPW